MRRVAREAALWVGATCGLLVVVGAVASVFFGVNLLVFRSGSMGPDIPTGSLALSHRVDADALRVGDVVSVRTDSGDRVTHRVTQVTVRHDRASLVLRGDANATPDDEVYVVRGADRVVFSVPRVGFAVTALATGPGLVLAAGLMTALLMVIFSPQVPQQRQQPHAPVALVIAILLIGTGVASRSPLVQGTWATFTDPATVASDRFSGATLSSPPSIGCVEQPGLLSQYVDLSWTPTSTAFAHRISLESAYGTVVITPDVPAGTTTYRLTAAGVATVLSLAGTATVRIGAVSGTGWVAADSTTRTIRRTSLLGLGLDVRCT